MSHHFNYETALFICRSFESTDVKTMGSWTRALHKQEGDNLTVHVDGFYGDGSTLASMKNAKGFQRVVLFAGGSGVTSFTAMIQAREAGVFRLAAWRTSVSVSPLTCLVLE